MQETVQINCLTCRKWTDTDPTNVTLLGTSLWGRTVDFPCSHCYQVRMAFVTDAVAEKMQANGARTQPAMTQEVPVKQTFTVTVVCGECHEFTCVDVESLKISRSRRAYAHNCATCGVFVWTKSRERFINHYLGSGAKEVVGNEPAEIFEEKTGAALTKDDLLDFWLQLQQVDDLAAYAQARKPSPSNR